MDDKMDDQRVFMDILQLKNAFVYKSEVIQIPGNSVKRTYQYVKCYPSAEWHTTNCQTRNYNFSSANIN